MTMTYPERLDGSARRDRLMSTLTGVVAAYTKMSTWSGRRRPPVRAVDRKLYLTVEDVRAEASDVVSLRLTGTLPPWRPGAHIDLTLPSGLVRQYSLCGDPADLSHYRVAVRKIGAASSEVHSLTPGTRVTAQGPRTAFPLLPAEKYLFIAGGIGITPILPMVRHADAIGADWRLVYAGRDRDSMPFLDELSALGSARIFVRPDSEFGMPVSGAELLENAAPGAAIYCCGPIPMITGVRQATEETVFYERFSPPPIVAGKPFRLTLRSGRTLEVPADRSALDVLREAIPGVTYSCRQGFCGTCAIPDSEGTPVRVCVDREPVTLDI
ncbi:Ferredoxin-NADP reductase [Amycolatopsis xylanica]|uniref:Ferredoxin-NADP reductase n=1 Tax=Amycolatopsis xylanica TaxID=589385 RepID=A0A1H3A2F1_9PSEU|nr:Ferredoxin-NADP reductase [Amycolatopsis xylanica]